MSAEADTALSDMAAARLYTGVVTSARDGLDERQLAAQPHAGAVFTVDAGTRGLPALRFAG